MIARLNQGRALVCLASARRAPIAASLAQGTRHLAQPSVKMAKRKHRGDMPCPSVMDDGVFLLRWDQLSQLCLKHSLASYGPRAVLLDRLVGAWRPEWASPGIHGHCSASRKAQGLPSWPSAPSPMPLHLTRAQALLNFRP